MQPQRSLQRQLSRAASLLDRKQAFSPDAVYRVRIPQRSELPSESPMSNVECPIRLLNFEMDIGYSAICGSIVLVGQLPNPTL